MIGKLYIDGIDVYDKYGVFVAENGYNDLIAYPPLKNVDSNDWPEEDGVEADLASPALDSMEFSIKLAAHGDKLQTGAFIALLSDKAYHEFNFIPLGAKYKLRLVSQPNLSIMTGLEEFALQLANDFPLAGYSYKKPNATTTDEQGYDLDAVDFSKYGIHVMRGSLSEVMQSPAVKRNLLTGINVKHGAVYDGEVVLFQPKEAKLNLFLRAKSLAEFWHNYNALLYDLVRPQERILYVDDTGYEYPVYYKSSSVSELSIEGGVWLKFSVALVFTSFRAGPEEYLLASEAGEWIVTEDDETAIDLGYGD